MRRPLTLMSTAAVVPLVAALFAVPAQAAEAAPQHVPVWDRGVGGERYVAFGDSFVSGPGIRPQRTDVGCARSEKNFPTLVAQGVEATSYVDASCGGATTRHFTAPQSSVDYTNAPQLDALSQETTLVTFGTMGGNDIGLVQLAGQCAFNDCVPAPGQDPLAEAFAGVEGRLVAALDETRRRAPNAEVLVVGYGTYLPPGGCDPVVPLDPAKANYLQGQIDRLSDLLERIAAEQGVAFVDQRDIPGAVDHTVCAEPEDQWIRGLEAYDDGVLFHPSTAGMRATADHVLTRLAEERAEPAPGPTKAERRAALRAKAKTVKARVSCAQQGRQVRATVRGGRRAIARVALRAGGTRLKVDTTQPYVLRVKSQRVQRLPGRRVRVRVTLRDQRLKHVRWMAVRRPRCAR